MSDDLDPKLVDPPRLADDGEGELGRMLRAGSRDLPDEARMAALAVKLGPILGGGGAASGGGGGAGAGQAKVAATAGKAAGVAHAASAGAGVKLLGAVLVATSVIGVGALGVSKWRAPTAAVVPASSMSAGGVAIVESAPTPPSIASIPADEPTLSAHAATSASAPASTGRAAPRVEAANPEDEVKLLEQAQDALRTSPARALAICEDHARRYPHGTLVQEREVIAIEALQRSGRTAEARARADRFEKAYPSSTHLRRVEAIVGGTP